MTAAALPFGNLEQALAATDQVVEHLRSDGLIAYPTETVYGLGGSTSTSAVESLSKLKGRDPEKSFLILVSGQEMLDSLGVEWPSAAQKLAAQHWPGPLTLVLRPTVDVASLPKELVGAGNGIAVRWTSHELLSLMIAAFGEPITSTSANTSGSAPANSSSQIASNFETAISEKTLLLLDGGELPPSRPSTVVDCTRGVPRLLREGALSAAEITATIPELIGNW
jgi:L-threonylcarbamoyladenylate synthase